MIISALNFLSYIFPYHQLMSTYDRENTSKTCNLIEKPSHIHITLHNDNDDDTQNKQKKTYALQHIPK